MISTNRLKECFRYEDGQLIRINSKEKRLQNKPAGSPTKNGYISVAVDGKKYLLHRLIWFYFNGYFPDNVDHRDKDKSNNRIENLREADKSKNEANTGLRTNNTSGYKGVSFMKTRNKYRARLADMNLGHYDTALEAALVYDAAGFKKYGEYFSPNIEKE